MKKFLITSAIFFGTLFLSASETLKPAFRYRAGVDVPGKVFTFMDKKPEILRNGILKFNKDSGFAFLAGTQHLAPGKRGFTLMCTIKLPADLGSQDLFALFYKDQSFRINRFRQRGLYVNLTPQKGKNEELKGGNLLPLDEWINFAFTAEFINDTAQGNVGYVVRYFINDELITERMLRYFEPNQPKSSIAFGRGNNGGHNFVGELANISVYDRFLPESEIIKLVAADKRVKLFVPPGVRRADAKIVESVKNITEKNVSSEVKFIASALGRADTQMADTQEVAAALKLLDSIKNTSDVKTLTAKFNAGQKFFRLTATEKVLLLTVREKGRCNPAILDIYNRDARCNTFGGRAFGWEITAGKNKINDFSENTTYTVDNFKETPEGAEFTVNYRNGTIGFSVYYNLKNGRLTAEAQAFSSQNAVTGIKFPEVSFAKLPGKDTIVVPHQSGTLYENAASGCMVRGIYPGAEMTMAFLGYYNDRRNAVYLGFEDPSGNVKQIAVNGKNNTVSISVTHTAGVVDPAKGNRVALPGVTAMEFYSGDWFEAGQIYKEFLRKYAYWFVRDLPRKDTPQWYMKNTMWVRGNRWDEVNGAPYMFFLDYFGLPYSLVGGRPKNYTELHKKGFNVKVYTNIRLWRYTPAVNIASPQAKDYIAMQNSPEGQAAVVRMANGAIRNEQFGGIMWNVGCPMAQGLIDQRKKVDHDHFKLDFVTSIYHDQLNSNPEVCYSPCHGHLPGDPGSWVRGNREFLTWYRQQREYDPELTQDGEDSSEIYTDLVDGLMPWRYVHVNQVPLFQSIYSGGRVQFTGRSYNNCVPGDEASWFCKSANQFIFGEQIGWFRIEEMFKADMKRVFIKKLMHLRYGLLEYFNASDMLRPLDFKGEVPTIKSVWGGLRIGTRIIENHKIQSSAWKHVHTGNIMVVFVNTVNEKVKVQPQLNYSGKLVICREGATETATPLPGTIPAVELEPYACEVWFFGNDTVTPAEIQKKLAEFPSYTPGKDVDIKLDPKILLM